MNELDMLDMLDWLAPVQHDTDIELAMIEWPALVEPFIDEDEWLDE